MQKRIKTSIISIIMIGLLLLMWRLSSADGTETLEDSMRVTKKVAVWLFGSATEGQLDHLNMVIRKLAHVFLYMIFGLIVSIFWDLLWWKHRLWTRAILAFGCCTVIAFIDELQKIPISGRHFSASESMLNAVSADGVILLYFLFLWIIQLYQHRNNRN
ncbi:MAG: VanZ family protein [Ruminococcus sp.]|nr:VanZ family protein [Ruminococcus sp.]